MKHKQYNQIHTSNSFAYDIIELIWLDYELNVQKLLHVLE